MTVHVTVNVILGADIVFFVTARPIAAQTGSDTIAFSGHCEVDQFGRPIAAHFNWSPVHLDVPNSDFESTYVVKELLVHSSDQPVPSSDIASTHVGGWLMSSLKGTECATDCPLLPPRAQVPPPRGAARDDARISLFARAL